MVVSKTDDVDQQGFFANFSQKGTITMMNRSKTIITKKKLKAPTSPYSVTEVEGQSFLAPKFRYGSKCSDDDSSMSASENLFGFDEWKSKFPNMNLDNILEKISSGSLGCLCPSDMFQGLSTKSGMSQDLEETEILSLTPSDIVSVKSDLQPANKNDVINNSGVDHDAREKCTKTKKGGNILPNNEEKVSTKKGKNNTDKHKKNNETDRNEHMSKVEKNNFHSNKENLKKVSTTPIEDEVDVFKYFMFEPQQPESASFFLDDDESIVSEINKVGGSMPHATSLNQCEEEDDLWRLKESDFDKENYITSFNSKGKLDKKKKSSSKQINPHRTTSNHQNFYDKSNATTNRNTESNIREPKSKPVNEIVLSNNLKSYEPDDKRINRNFPTGEKAELNTHKKTTWENKNISHRDRKLKNRDDESKNSYDSKGRKKFDEHSFFEKIKKNAVERLAKDPGFVNGCCSGKKSDTSSDAMNFADDFIMTTFKRLPSDM